MHNFNLGHIKVFRKWNFIKAAKFLINSFMTSKAFFIFCNIEKLDQDKEKKSKNFLPYLYQSHLLLILTLLIVCLYILSNSFLPSVYSKFSVYFVVVSSILSIFSKKLFLFKCFLAFEEFPSSLKTYNDVLL